MHTTLTPSPAAEPQAAAERFWPYRWWRVMELRIGIVPVPVFVTLALLLAGFVLRGEVTGEISMAIAILSVCGFACAELGKRRPHLTDEGKLRPGEEDEMQPSEDEITGHVDVTHTRCASPSAWP